jgi:carbon-monoxide dehydrogenase medium subunit
MEFRSADTVDEAVAWLTELGDEAQVLAGGTDVMIQHMRREINPSVLLHINRIPGLDVLGLNGSGRIGPLVTHRSLATDPVSRAAFPALAEAAATVGGWQTQEVATVGGNLCNASPAADTAPPLLVAGARLTLTGADGSRTVALDQFFKGRRSTERRPDELLTEIAADPVGPGTGETYLKLGRRRAMEVAVVGLAVRLTLDPAGTVERARVAAASIGPRPFRALEAESLLQGSRLEDDAVAEAAGALAASASPIDDARATASYRLRVLPGMLARAVAVCRARADGGV